LKAFLKTSLYAVVSVLPLAFVRILLSLLRLRARTTLDVHKGYRSERLFEGGRHVQRVIDDAWVSVADNGVTLTKKPVVIALVGLPQTGKSTVAETIAGTLGAIVIANNDWRNYWVRHGEGNSFVNEVELHMLDEVLGEKHNVIMDSDYANPAKRRFLEAVASKHDAEVIYVIVGCSLHIWEKRISRVGHHFGQLYHDAIEGTVSGDRQGTAVATIVHGLLVECVCQEYDRQKSGHEELAIKGEHTRVFSNDGSELVFKKAVELYALWLVEKFGSTLAIKQFAQKKREAFLLSI
jgi:predicted kinase